jgi:FtsZ-binding cell division protein ZapB
MNEKRAEKWRREEKRNQINYLESRTKNERLKDMRENWRVSIKGLLSRMNYFILMIGRYKAFGILNEMS